MLQLSSDLWISEAALEQLAPGRYIARVKVETADETRIDMFALPPEWRPTTTNHRKLTDELAAYYLEG